MNDLITKLNSSHYLPQEAYRRNHELYELVCYVNCLPGCKLGWNLEGDALYTNRINEYITKHPPIGETAKYYDVVSSYVT